MKENTEHKLDTNIGYPEIAEKLIELGTEDQAIRNEKAIGIGNNPLTWKDIKKIDTKNFRELEQIVRQIGWPTNEKVGEHASNMAWIIVQHIAHSAKDIEEIEFQEECLKLMKKEPEGNINIDNIKYLEDRNALLRGKPQIHGTQIPTNN